MTDAAKHIMLNNILNNEVTTMINFSNIHSWTSSEDDDVTHFNLSSSSLSSENLSEYCPGFLDEDHPIKDLSGDEADCFVANFLKDMNHKPTSQECLLSNAKEMGDREFTPSTESAQQTKAFNVASSRISAASPSELRCSSPKTPISPSEAFAVLKESSPLSSANPSSFSLASTPILNSNNRKRGVSHTEKEMKDLLLNNKRRMSSREHSHHYRLKKKQHLKNLEMTVQRLSEENARLKAGPSQLHEPYKQINPHTSFQDRCLEGEINELRKANQQMNDRLSFHLKEKEGLRAEFEKLRAANNERNTLMSSQLEEIAGLKAKLRKAKDHDAFQSLENERLRVELNQSLINTQQLNTNMLLLLDENEGLKTQLALIYNMANTILPQVN